MKKVTVTITDGVDTLQFCSNMSTAADVHSLQPGDVTPYNFEDRSKSLAADIDDLLTGGELNNELGRDVTSFKVSQVAKGSKKGMLLIEV
jgi:hypothetical protein